MVKTGKTRSEKFAAKHDPLAIMLRLKRMQALAKLHFQVPATQDAYIDQNVKQWAIEFDLPFGQRAVLSDITKEYVWKISEMSAFQVDQLHALFLAKGFTEEQWTSFYVYLLAKQVEIFAFYGYCDLITAKLRSDITLQNVIESEPVMIERYMKETVINDTELSDGNMIEIPVERKAASILQSKACCHYLVPALAPSFPSWLKAFNSAQNLSPSFNIASANLAVQNRSPILTVAVAYEPILAYEDFTTFVEVDPNNHITVNSSRVDGILNRNETAYVYKDKGVDHFSGDFEHLFTAKTFQGTGNENALDYMWAISNTIGSKNSWIAHTVCILFQNNSPYACYLFILPSNISSAIVLSLNTVYYFKIKRVGNDVTLYVYSDAARTTLVATRTVTDSSKISARYLYAISTDNGNYDRYDGNTYIESLNLQE